MVRLQLVAMHQYELLWILGCVLRYAWMGYPTQLATLSVPQLWAHWGPKFKGCLFPLWFLLPWVTHRNLFLGGKILPSLHLIAYSLFKEMLFSQKDRATGCEMHFTGSILCQKEKAFLLLRLYIVIKGEMRRKLSLSCVFSYFRNTWKETLRGGKLISNNSNPFIPN